jgi:hypothetical protein
MRSEDGKLSLVIDLFFTQNKKKTLPNFFSFFFAKTVFAAFCLKTVKFAPKTFLTKIYFNFSAKHDNSQC